MKQRNFGVEMKRSKWNTVVRGHMDEYGDPHVPVGVLQGIADVANENFATKEEIDEALDF